jgi:hypothetical protein
LFISLLGEFEEWCKQNTSSAFVHLYGFAAPAYAIHGVRLDEQAADVIRNRLRGVLDGQPTETRSNAGVLFGGEFESIAFNSTGSVSLRRVMSSPGDLQRNAAVSFQPLFSGIANFFTFARDGLSEITRQPQALDVFLRVNWILNRELWFPPDPLDLAPRRTVQAAELPQWDWQGVLHPGDPIGAFTRAILKQLAFRMGYDCDAYIDDWGRNRLP